MANNLSHNEMAQILCIEDNRMYARLLSRFLNRNGFKTSVAYTGVEGLHLAKTDPFDLILLDVCIPDIDGIRILEQLRGNGKTADVPVILISGVKEALSPFRSAAAAFGNTRFLVKTVSSGELLRTIKDCMSGVEKTARAPDSNTLLCGRITVRTDSRAVFVDGSQIRRLGPKRFDLLVELMRSEDGLSKETLLERLWSDGETIKTVDRTIARLREDLESAGIDEPIVTLPGGYRLFTAS